MVPSGNASNGKFDRQRNSGSTQLGSILKLSILGDRIDAEPR